MILKKRHVNGSYASFSFHSKKSTVAQRGCDFENLTIPSYQMKNIYKEENKKKGLKCGKSIL